MKQKVKDSSTVEFLNSLSAPGRQIMALPIDAIRPDPDQPRKSFSAIDGMVSDEDQMELENLAGSIAKDGLHQPITVREMPDGDYQIVMGERRWRAVKLNNERGVPNSGEIECIVRQDLKGADLRFAQLAENLQRQDLTDLETAMHFKAILTEFPELQKQELAKLLNMRNSYITRILALLDPQWAHVVDAGIVTYATLLEQFKSLPVDSRQELVTTAKNEGRSLTSSDMRGAREKAKGGPKGASKGNNLESGSGRNDDWPFSPPGEGGKGLNQEVVDEVAKFVSAEAKPGETYQYRGVSAASATSSRTIVDTGGDAMIPHGIAALDPALFHGKREVKMTMDQLEVLLRMESFETKGHLVSVMLPDDEIKNALNMIGGSIPDDDHQLVTALIKRINDLKE